MSHRSRRDPRRPDTWRDVSSLIATRPLVNTSRASVFTRAQFSLPLPRAGGRVVRPLNDRRLRPIPSPARARRIFALGLNGLRFDKRSITCIRRSVRSRVLHALGVAGRRGVGAGKPRRLTHDSKFTC